MPLSDEARRIVDDARAAYGPSDEVRARVGAMLPLHLAAAAGAATAASTGPSVAAAPAGFLAGKGVLVGLTALVVVGGASLGYWWSGTEARGPRAPSAVSAVSTPAVRTMNQAAPPSSPPSATVKMSQLQAPARANRSRSTLAARAITAKVGASDPGPDVAGEIALLNEAQRALASGQADRALQILDRHAHEFPRGSLAEERAAARILALCALGRVTAARAETAAFVRQSPESPLVERVRAACGK
jgi:RNA polymerase sigma-70 factor (ECF subfamily)